MLNKVYLQWNTPAFTPIDFACFARMFPFYTVFIPYGSGGLRMFEVQGWNSHAQSHDTFIVNWKVNCFVTFSPMEGRPPPCTSPESTGAIWADRGKAQGETGRGKRKDEETLLMSVAPAAWRILYLLVLVAPRLPVGLMLCRSPATKPQH